MCDAKAAVGWDVAIAVAEAGRQRQSRQPAASFKRWTQHLSLCLHSPFGPVIPCTPPGPRADVAAASPCTCTPLLLPSCPCRRSDAVGAGRLATRSASRRAAGRQVGASSWRALP